VDSAQLLTLIGRFRECTVAVVGDVVADEFVYGRVARVSREAPVLILEYDTSEIVAGAAGNAASNVAALGAQARLATLVGRDAPARRLLAALHRRVDRSCVVRAARLETPVKTRILAGGVHSAKQQVVRIDRGLVQVPDARTKTAFARAALAAVRGADAVLLSDYGSGLVTPKLAATLRAAARQGRRTVPVLIDSRYDVTRYRGLTACTPNESEVEEALGIRIGDDGRALERAGRRILTGCRMQAVLITRGGRGMALFQPGRPTVHIPIFGSDEIADVTGAGDTVMATMTLALGTGATCTEAARLANYAGGLVVMKRGTATVTAAALRAAVRRDAAGATV
jgi:rfaE bifunctional protein kinase chain/domain